MPEVHLKVDQIRMRYGSLEVLKGVSLSVNKGEAFSVIGPNGAGKTSLFKVMTGEVRATAGSVHIGGENVTSLPAYKRSRMGVGRTFQVARVFPDFTALNNVITTIESRERGAGRPVGAWYQWRPSSKIRDEAQAFLADVGLLKRQHSEAKFLSHGDKKRLELAITLAQKPSILMLDEPTAGMAPSDRAAVIELIARLRRERGVTVVMTEHDMEVVFGISDRLAVLNYGEIIASGNVEEVRQNPMVREVYLGKEMYSA